MGRLPFRLGQMARLMVVEDDIKIGGHLESSLRSHGHEVVWQRTGYGAVREAETCELALVLLDLGLPDLDGVEVCRQLRSRQPGAVLVILTARAEEMDVVVGLEAGADDYLTKPVRLAELHARIRAHLRRGTSATGCEGPAVYLAGDLQVDTAARRVSVGAIELQLRPREFDLLACLASQPGIAVSRSTLMADVWDAHRGASTKTLDVHVASLRRKMLAFADADLPKIVTLRGRGFRFEPPASCPHATDAGR
jgi:DNA-binding response OmpR family regulator